MGGRLLGLFWLARGGTCGCVWGVVVVWGGGCWVCFGWQGAVRVDVFGLLRHGVGLAAGGLCGVEFRGLGFRGLGLRVITSACAHMRAYICSFWSGLLFQLGAP